MSKYTFGEGAHHVITKATVPVEISFKLDPPPPATEGEAQYLPVVTVRTGKTRLPKDSQVVVLKRGPRSNVIELSGVGPKKRPPEYAPLRPKASPTGEYSLRVGGGSVTLVTHGAGSSVVTEGPTHIKPAAGDVIELVWGTEEETKDNKWLPDGTVLTALSGFELPGDEPVPQPQPQPVPEPQPKPTPQPAPQPTPQPQPQPVPVPPPPPPPGPKPDDEPDDDGDYTDADFLRDLIAIIVKRYASGRNAELVKLALALAAADSDELKSVLRAQLLAYLAKQAGGKNAELIALAVELAEASDEERKQLVKAKLITYLLTKI